MGEVAVSVYPERLASRTQVRGHLTGPRCPYSTTVEVAYPWRETSRTYEKEGEPCISTRTTIPEPSLWEPQTPFLYEGIVELWDDGELCDRVTLPLGLRNLALGSRGFVLNGRPFAVRGVARAEIRQEDLPALHQAGFNTLLTPFSPDKAELWDASDQVGFLVIGWLAAVDCGETGRLFNKHTSCLGVVLAEAAGDQRLIALALSGLLNAPLYEPWVGFEAINEVSGPPPKDGFRSPPSSFQFCDRSLLANLASIPAPKLVRLRQASLNETESQELLATPGVCGWVLAPLL